MTWPQTYDKPLPGQACHSALSDASYETNEAEGWPEVHPRVSHTSKMITVRCKDAIRKLTRSSMKYKELNKHCALADGGDSAVISLEAKPLRPPPNFCLEQRTGSDLPVCAAVGASLARPYGHPFTPFPKVSPTPRAPSFHSRQF